MASTVTTAPPWPWLRAVRGVLRVGVLSGGPPILVACRTRLTGATTRVGTASLAGPLASRVALPLSLSLSGACLATLTVAIGTIGRYGRIGSGALTTQDALLSRRAPAAARLMLATGLGVGGVAGSRAATSAPAGVSG